MRETTIASQLSDTWSEGDVSPSQSLTDQAPCYKWRKLRLKKGSDFPRNRSKHGACRLGEYVYICCGKDVSLSLKDLWRFSIEKGKWESLSYRGDRLPHLQGLSMISHRTLLYLFGGEFSPSLDDAPLWIYHTDLFYLRKVLIEPGQPHPTGRRDHSVVIYREYMYVYGGYVDLKGSSDEFWQFDFDSESWDLMPCTGQSVDEIPGGRHGHTAVVYDQTMWIYGGMSNLVPKPELWAWHFGRCQWNRIRTRITLPALVGHTADVIGDSMFVLGGEVRGETQNALWRFRFECLSWERVEFGTCPIPSLSYHCTALSLPLLGTPEDQPNRSVSLPALRRQSRQQARLSDRPGTSPGNQMRASESAHSGIFHNKIFPKAGDNTGPRVLVVAERNTESTQAMAANRLGGFVEPAPATCKRENIELSTFGDKDACVSVNDRKPLLKHVETFAGNQVEETGEDNPTFVPSPATTGKSPFADQVESDSSKTVSQRQNKMLRDVIVNQARIPTDSKNTSLKQVDLLKLEELPKRKSFSADDLILEDLEQAGSVAKLFQNEENQVDNNVQNTQNKSVNSEQSHCQNTDSIHDSLIEDHFNETASPALRGGHSAETAFSPICQGPSVQECSSPDQTTSPKRSSSYIKKDTASIFVFGGRDSDRRHLGKQPVTVWKCDIPISS